MNVSALTHWFRRHPISTLLLGLLLVLLLLIGWLWFKPFNVDNPQAANPVASYAEATERIAATQAAEEARGDLNAVCHTQLMDQGQKTEKVIVFLHGFTSCPDQFVALGEAFFAQGYNVYIPRVPHHGLADLMTEDLLNLTAEEMAAFSMETADIAQGLGEHVTVSGLSGGGTMATWLAQEREDVELAAPIAPFLGIGFIPAILNRPLANAMLLIPNLWLWWDPQTRENNPNAAPYSYRRYPTHALAEVLHLGFAAEQDGRQIRPLAYDIVMISNANDQSVNNRIIDEFVATWRAHGDETVQTYRFERALGLPHDLITTTRPNAQIDVVYPVLLELMGAQSE